MKPRLVMGLWVIFSGALMGALFNGLVVAGNVGKGPTSVSDENGFFHIGPGTQELEALAVPPARVEKTGQTTSYGPRDDGRLRRGVPWPKPRFTDNGNGTVTDNLSGLIWLKDAYCAKFWAADATDHNWRTWIEALKAANNLKSGSCGLSDGSAAGDWRLPNTKELQSLTDFKFKDPALSDTTGEAKHTYKNPFLGPALGCYFSSTTQVDYDYNAWAMGMDSGMIYGVNKTSSCCVWPVRNAK